MKYTVENIQEGIALKLDELFNDDLSKPTANVLKFLFKEYPKEIEQNILEWINDMPFTDIDCHGQSFGHIATSMNLSKYQIPQLIENFIIFKQLNFNDPIVCYRHLRNPNV